MNPDIQITFEDLFSTKYELEKDAEYLVPDVNTLRQDIFSIFRGKLKEHINYTSDFFTTQLKLKQSFNVVVTIHYSSAPENIYTLAYFDVRKTILKNDSNYYFGFYLKTLYHYKSGFFGNAGTSNRVTQLWIHEFVHLLDYLNLKTFYLKTRQLQLNLNENLNIYGSNQTVASDSAQFLNLLYMLSKLRNEGIAQLFDKLKNPTDEHFCNINEAKSVFQQTFYPLVNGYAARRSIRQYDFVEEYNERYNSLCYSLGHWFILFSIANSTNTSYSSLANKALKSLESKSKMLYENEIILLIHEALHKDFGCYLYNLTNPFTSETCSILTIQELLSIVDEFTKQCYDSEFDIDRIAKIISATQENEPQKFINELEDIVGYCMSDEEIDEEYNILINSWKDSGMNYFTEFYNKLKMVYQIWQDSRNDILQWALTYVLDPVDLINDKILYFGFLDDMLVMDGAIYLAKTKKLN